MPIAPLQIHVYFHLSTFGHELCMKFLVLLRVSNIQQLILAERWRWLLSEPHKYTHTQRADSIWNSSCFAIIQIMQTPTPLENMMAKESFPLNYSSSWVFSEWTARGWWKFHISYYKFKVHFTGFIYIFSMFVVRFLLRRKSVTWHVNKDVNDDT